MGAVDDVWGVRGRDEKGSDETSESMVCEFRVVLVMREPRGEDCQMRVV